MGRAIKKFLYGLLYEQNEPSLTRVIIATAFCVFVLGTVADIILAVHNIRWPDYGIFAAITGGGAITGKVGDKIATTLAARKYGAPPGQMPPPILKNPPTGNSPAERKH